MNDHPSDEFDPGDAKDPGQGVTPVDSSGSDVASDPGVDSVYRYLMYGISLPERAVRSSAAMIGGAINESATLLVPQAFRDSTTYRKFVQQMMDMVNQDVGGVKPVPADDPAVGDATSSKPIENYVAKKTVGTFLDLAGMATLHLSPITLLAITSDLAHGSTTYLTALADELKKEGVIAEDSTIANTAGLLDAIAKASSDTTDRLDTPPLSVDGLRETIEQTRKNLATIDPTKILPQSEIKRLWDDMQSLADQQHVNLFEVSSAMTMYSLDQLTTATQGALTTVRVTGNLLDQHIFDHYWNAAGKIGREGIYSVAAQSGRPYVDALWYNFASDRPTLTEDLVSGKMIGNAWSGLREWFSKPKADPNENHDSPEKPEDT